MAVLMRAYVWLFLSALLFGLVSLWIESGGSAEFDAWIIARVQGWESDGITRLMEGFSWLGSTKTVILLVLALGVLFFFALRHRAELILLAAAVGGSAVLNVLIKKVFRRERPDLHRIVEEVGFGYPSGHSVAAVALYGVLACLLWKHLDSRKGKAILVITGLLLTAGIGLSRIYLGVHYPTDVVGGYFISGFWLALCIEGYRYFGKTGRVAAQRKK